MWACLLARWRATLGYFAYFWLAAGAALAIVLALVIILGGEIEAGPVLVFFLFLAAVVIALLLWDLIQCLVSPSSPPPPPPPPVGGGLTNAVDCATAQQMLADARARASQLQAQINAQVSRVAAAQQALNTARMSLSAAATAVAASAFFPWALPVALAALAAATYLTWQRAKTLEAELTTLEALANALYRTQLDVATDEMLVSQACPPAGPLSGPTIGGISLTAGALQIVARGRGRRIAPPQNQ